MIYYVFIFISLTIVFVSDNSNTLIQKQLGKYTTIKTIDHDGVNVFFVN